jgi:GNAT superfamily N-acetyltransferase
MRLSRMHPEFDRPAETIIRIIVMSIEIHPLTIDRLDEALQVWEATLGNGFKLDRQEVADRLQNGTGLFYIALDDESDRIVGIKFGYLDGEVCIGRGIGILPEYRRQGIATRLLRSFEQDLQANPAIKVYAFGSATTEGVPFHIAAGYNPQVLVQFTDSISSRELYIKKVIL